MVIIVALVRNVKQVKHSMTVKNCHLAATQLLRVQQSWAVSKALDSRAFETCPCDSSITRDNKMHRVLCNHTCLYIATPTQMTGTRTVFLHMAAVFSDVRLNIRACNPHLNLQMWITLQAALKERKNLSNLSFSFFTFNILHLHKCSSAWSLSHFSHISYASTCALHLTRLPSSPSSTPFFRFQSNGDINLFYVFVQSLHNTKNVYIYMHYLQVLFVWLCRWYTYTILDSCGSKQLHAVHIDDDLDAV